MRRQHFLNPFKVFLKDIYFNRIFFCICSKIPQERAQICIKKKSGRPLKLYEAALFQFINPKAWTIAITVVSAFFPSEENFYLATIFLNLNKFRVKQKINL